MTPEEAEKQFAKIGASAIGRATVATERTGLWMMGEIRRNASGRPGPNAPTGDYRRSWSTNMDTTNPAQPTALVGTNAPQALRLEYGFFGVDSLGRNYRQPPYPHVEKAVEPTEREFARQLLRMFSLDEIEDL